MTVTNEEEEQKAAQRRRRRRKKKGRRSHVMDVWVNKAAHKKAAENVWNQTSNSRSSSASNMYPRCVTSVCLRQPSVTGSYRSERHAHMDPLTSCRFYTCSRIELGSSKSAQRQDCSREKNTLSAKSCRAESDTSKHRLCLHGLL